MAPLRELIQPASLERCGDRSLPVLSMTMHDGIMLQSDRFKKSLASVDQSAYKVVRRNQLVVGFPIDEGVLYIQQVADAGIMSPAYDVWNVDETKVNLQYFELCLHSPQSMMFYKTNLRGTTARRRSLPKETLLSLPVPVPSMERQREIASTIGRLKELIELRQLQLRTLDTLIKARFVEMFGDPVINPFCFPMLTLGEISKLITKGASPSWQGFSYTDDDTQTLFVTSENVREGYIDISNPKYIEDGFNDKQKRSMLQKGDFLINIVGASIGRAAQFDLECKANINQATALVRIDNDRIRDKYLLIYLNSEKAQQMYNGMKSDTGRANLSLQDINDLSIMLPPVEEQIQFERFIVEVYKSKVAVQAALDKTQLLFDSLLQKYFG